MTGPVEPWVIRAAIVCGLVVLPFVGFLLWSAGYERGRRDRAYEDYMRGKR